MRHGAGEVINGRYEIISLVSAGGMGALYLAQDRTFSNRKVALKQMLEEVPEEDKDVILRHFREEALLLSQLKHQNIPTVVDYFTADDIPYVTMEFIDGDSLERVLKDYMKLSGQPMPAPRVVHYAIQICDVLAYLHNLQPPVLHRDVKPANVILRRDRDEVVLVDFGLAFAQESSGGASRSMVGTLGYASLEQVQGRPDNTSDLYGLGATMFHLLSGQAPAPFEIPLLGSVMAVHPMLEEVVCKAVSAPETRYVAAQQMAQDLRQVEAELARPSSQPAVMPIPPPKVPPPQFDATPQTAASPPPSWLWAALGTVAAVVLIAIGALLPGLMRRPDPPPLAQAATSTPVSTATPFETPRVAATPVPTPSAVRVRTPRLPRPRPSATPSAVAVVTTTPLPAPTPHPAITIYPTATPTRYGGGRPPPSVPGPPGRSIDDILGDPFAPGELGKWRQKFAGRFLYMFERQDHVSVISDIDLTVSGVSSNLILSVASGNVALRMADFHRVRGISNPKKYLGQVEGPIHEGYFAGVSLTDWEKAEDNNRWFIRPFWIGPSDGAYRIHIHVDGDEVTLHVNDLPAHIGSTPHGTAHQEFLGIRLRAAENHPEYRAGISDLTTSP